MLVIEGGDLLLPGGVIQSGTLVVEKDRIRTVGARPTSVPGATILDATDCYVAPGFIDVHVHGVEGGDTLDEGEPLAAMAAALPRYGVTAFCPTTVACAPPDLRRLLQQVEGMQDGRPVGARVLPAHLESNFINPEFCGAQPSSCLRIPDAAPRQDGAFTGADILAVIDAHRHAVGIVTVAPEIDGGLALVRRLVEAGHYVSLGHSASTFEQAEAAFDAGATQATHLFNRMPALGHRTPGLAGAALTRDDVHVELICDGYHVHAAIARVAIAAKSAGRVMAITDGTGGSGLAAGSTARLGGRRIHVRDTAAFLDDGTLAGSTLTMDRAFRTIVREFGRPVTEAAVMCATTPARALGLQETGVLEAGARADVVVLDRDFRVRHTVVGGVAVFAAA